MSELSAPQRSDSAAASPDLDRRQASPRRRARLGAVAGVVIGAGLVVAVAALWPGLAGGGRGAPAPAVGSGEAPVGAADWKRTTVSEAELADLIGVRIVRVALTGGGGLIDLRFQVVDADKAAAIHRQATPPAVVDDASGVVARDLLMGHSHSDPFKAGVTYYLIFENPGDLLDRGGTVSVLLGPFEVDHVAVR